MTKKPILEESGWSNHWLLVCPKCGENYLHHDRINVFNRKQEDSDVGLRIQVNRLDYSIDTGMDGNPSPRRDGIEILFWCEMCDFLSRLAVLQHKGQTFVTFNYFERPKTHKELYHEYLESPEWDDKRKAKLKEAGYRCQLCNAQTELSVHHRTYQNVFMELSEDLIALCQKCHEKFHDLDEA